MNYLCLKVIVQPVQPGSDILMALWAEEGFESFVLNTNGFDAYIQKDLYNESNLRFESFDFKYSFIVEEIKHENWNHEWEKNFSPVHVNEKCVIRAAFHETMHLPYEIIITPKMTFGTGHHETTRLMCRALFNEKIIGKTVLDMGCGTGVLGILAEKLGAIEVLGIEIEDWSTVNANENAKSNHCEKFNAICGDAGLLSCRNFDFILANINRNVLLHDIKYYANSLNKNGVLLLSGFFETDADAIKAEAQNYSLSFHSLSKEKEWACMRFLKI